ncbi:MULTISPECIES: hypothetical protein [unclassified Dysgonomonas]|nr:MULTISPECIES: hypothetical protein [unclassified Dysgonomonas]
MHPICIISDMVYGTLMATLCYMLACTFTSTLTYTIHKTRKDKNIKKEN